MVSIIIPTYNAAEHLPELLKSLKAQSVPCEIIVIDSSSPDNTVEISESYGARTINIKKENFDHGGTRTLARKDAKGDILVYLTQDALPANRCAIEKLIKPFQKNKRVGATFGRQLHYDEASLFSAHQRAFNYPEYPYDRVLEDKDKYGIKTAFISNSFAAYRCSALEAIGGFPKNTILGEDTYVASKMLLAGWKVNYCADAEVYHSHNYSVVEEFKRYFDIGVFHKTEDWILKEFGRAEGEGKRYVKAEFFYLMRLKKYHLIPELILRNGFKYLGYKLGRNYQRLPRCFSVKCSMHKGWWNERLIE